MYGQDRISEEGECLQFEYSIFQHNSFMPFSRITTFRLNNDFFVSSICLSAHVGGILLQKKTKKKKNTLNT